MRSWRYSNDDARTLAALLGAVLGSGFGGGLFLGNGRCRSPSSPLLSGGGVVGNSGLLLLLLLPLMCSNTISSSSMLPWRVDCAGFQIW